MPFDVRRILEDESFANQMTALGITQRQVAGMALYGKLADETEEFNEEEKELLSRFISQDCISHLELNEKISALTASASREGITPFAKIQLLNFTFKNRHMQNFTHILSKAKNLYENYLKGITATTDQKLSLTEYAILRDAAVLLDYLEKLNQAGILDKDKELKFLYYEHIKLAHQIVQFIDKEFDKNFKFPTGSYTFDHTKKKDEVQRKTLSYYDTLQTVFVSPYGHVAKGFEDKNQQSKLSHIKPDYREEKFSMRDYLYSDVYILKLETLISDKNKNLLEQKLGPEWLIKLNRSFQEIERQIHDGQIQLHAKKSATSVIAEIKSGVTGAVPKGLGHATLNAMGQFASYANPMNLFYPTSSSHFDKIHQEIFQKSKHDWDNKIPTDKVTLLCSTFIAETTIAALVELNQQLSRELGVHEPLIEIPIPASENLSLMHPQRFLDVLQQKECVEKMAEPRIVSSFINR